MNIHELIILIKCTDHMLLEHILQVAVITTF